MAQGQITGSNVHRFPLKRQISVMSLQPKSFQSNIIWLLVWNMSFIFHFIYGMSSFPLMNSIIFQDGFLTTNQS
jgi:hypothetical protein